MMVGNPIIEFTVTSLPSAKAIVYARPSTVKGVLYRITAERIPCFSVSYVLGSLIAPHNFMGSKGFVPLNSSYEWMTSGLLVLDFGGILTAPC